MNEFFRQERAKTCAVAALRSVLASQFGVRIPEVALRFAGDDAGGPILKEGTGVDGLRAMLAVANRAVNSGRRWRLRAFGSTATISVIKQQLARGRLVLASVQRGADMHMVVICGYRPGRIRYFDPGTGNTRWYGVGAFRREWAGSINGPWLAVVTGGTPL